jgi:hypothetical protein
VLAVWSQTDVTLEYLLHIDHETSRLACIWSNILALGLWPSMMNEALKKWLQCQVSSVISLSSVHTLTVPHLVLVHRILCDRSQCLPLLVL